MTERAALAGAVIEVETAPGMGTTVFARVPLPAVASIRAVNQTADAADSDP